MPSSRRSIPSVDRLLERPAIAAAVARHGRASVVDAVRRAADVVRAAVAHDSSETTGAEDAIATAREIEARALQDLDAAIAPSLRRVINATGVILHTNLGRAPLADDAIAGVAAAAAGYTNLEYDLPGGARGHRHAHAEARLLRLTGADAALVANNNAAAMLVVLAALANGREVIVSRGELVEIGGGFRVPDVLAQSGAILREVGTTNRTRVADYAAAIGERTALVLRVHPSNFQMTGFTERPGVGELATLAHRFDLPLVEDLGSGWLGVEDTPDALRGEPSVRASLAAGADLVAFSGDKLLGGPQAGLVVGRSDLIDRARRHPLMRAVRADKLTYAGLDATLGLWLQAPAREHIPVYRMITMPLDDIDRRARSLIDALRHVVGLRAAVVDGASTIGGGSAPESRLPTRLVAIACEAITVDDLLARLRVGDPAVVARVEHDRLVCDLRTVNDDEIDSLAAAIARAAESR